MGSEVFLPAVQGGFCTSHAVTGSETKETNTTTTPTTTADTSTAAAAAATSPLDPGHWAKNRSRWMRSLKVGRFPHFLSFWHPWMLHISCKPQLLQHRARKDSLRLPYIFSILDGSPVSSQITRGLQSLPLCCASTYTSAELHRINRWEKLHENPWATWILCNLLELYSDAGTNYNVGGCVLKSVLLIYAEGKKSMTTFVTCSLPNNKTTLLASMEFIGENSTWSMYEIYKSFTGPKLKLTTAF